MNLLLLIIIIILLLVLFSPNLVYYIHRTHFIWKNKVKNIALESYERGRDDGSEYPSLWHKVEVEDWLKENYNL